MFRKFILTCLLLGITVTGIMGCSSNTDSEDHNEHQTSSNSSVENSTAKK